MKCMKRIFLICLLFQNFGGSAQKTELFIKGGLNISKFSSENNENFNEVNSIASFNAGILARFPLAKKVALQPSLLISGKGAKTKGGEPPYTNTYFESSTQPYYLELPVNIVFDVFNKEKTSLFAGAGMYGAIGIAGKNKIEGKTISTGSFSDERKIDFADDQSSYPDFHNWAGIGYMNRFDYGITVTAGLYFKKLLISLDYALGLKNIDRGTRVTKDENKNQVFSLSVGWQIF